MILAAITGIFELQDFLIKYNLKTELSNIDKNYYQSIVSEKDRKRMLASRFLLGQLIEKYSMKNLTVNQIFYSKYGKPLLPGAFVSISHSGDYTAVTLSNTKKVGIDVQKQEKVDFRDYESFLTKEQIDDLYKGNEDQKIKYFFNIWTKKEAIMKADGRGMEIAPKDIQLVEDRAYIKDSDTIWYSHPCPKIDGYSLSLYSNSPKSSLKWLNFKNGDFYEIIV